MKKQAAEEERAFCWAGVAPFESSLQVLLDLLAQPAPDGFRGSRIGLGIEQYVAYILPESGVAGAEAGALVAEVRATKRSGTTHFALVDAGFHNLVRPAMYGSYHEISLLREAHTSL